MARSTSSRVNSLTFSREMVIVMFCTSFPRRFGALVTFVRHAQLQSKCAPGPCQEYFGEPFGSTIRPSGQTQRNTRLSSTDEGFPHETGDDRHGVFGEAKIEVFFVAEALEMSGG